MRPYKSKEEKEMAKQMKAEEVVVEYIQGVREVPEYLRKLVTEYRSRAYVADTCESYPRSVDREMDVLHDAMVILTR